MRLWITRTEPEAQATAERLRAMGHEPVVAPLLEVRPIPKVRPVLKGVAALAFTSRNGVAAFAALSKVRNLPVYTVGDATAHAARQAGFGAVSSAEGALADLIALIAVHPPAGPLLWIGPTEPAGDLAALLEPHGVKAALLPVYETVETQCEVPAVIDGVLIHSPKAARVLASRLTAQAARGLSLYAISQAAAEPLSHLDFHAVEIAPTPDETALLGLTIRPIGANQRTMTTTEPPSVAAAPLSGGHSGAHPGATDLPADPAVYRRGKGVGLPLVLLACLGSVVLGVAISRLIPGGERLEPGEPAASQPVLPWLSAPPPEAPVPPVPLPAPAVLAPSQEVADLSARIARLETTQNLSAAAATAALATSALSQAAQTSRPFTAELAAVESLLPQAEVAVLRRAAQTGVPTRSALAEEFPVYASRASAAAHTPAEGAGLVARATHALSSIVTIRRVEPGSGNSADAIIARAEQLVQDGDLEGALSEMRRLSPASRNAFLPWLAKAERRIEVDRRIVAVRAASLSSLAASLPGRHP